MRKNPKVKILIGYHKPAYLLKDDVLTPIHLGRKLSTEVSKDGDVSQEDCQWMKENMIGDDTGDNISSENRKYCELTALYWAWKNYDKLGNPDYIGFMQYRRHFIFDDNFDQSEHEKFWGCYRFEKANQNYCQQIKLNGKDIVEYLKKHPVDVLTTKEVDFNQSVAEHFSQTLSFLNRDDLKICVKTTENLFPEYKNVINQYMKSKKHYWYHCFIMKKEIFFEYCQWLFGVLFAVEKQIDYTGYTIAAKRTIAYLGERMWGVFLNAKKDKLVIDNLDLTFIDETSYQFIPKPFFDKNNVAVVFACDNNYVPYLSVAIQSIVDHKKLENNYDIIILNNGIIPYYQKLLKETYQCNNVSIRFYDVSNLYYTYHNLFYSHTYYSPTVYFRFFIPEIFTSYSHIIYLDCDLICLRDVADLYQQKLGNNLLGVVRDIEYLRIYNENKNVREYCDNVLQMKDYIHYFNSGVLLFNIKQCQKFNLSQKLLQQLQCIGKPMIVDQDILNSVCEGKVLYLDQCWNVEWHSYYLYGNLLPYQVPDIFYGQYLKAIKNPFILHYAIDVKPWDCPEHCTAEIFWHYAAKTPFFVQIIYKHFEQKIYALAQKLEQLPINNVQTNHQKKNHNNLFKYYKYKILSAILFGEKKQYYQQKKKIIKQQIKAQRRNIA